MSSGNSIIDILETKFRYGVTGAPLETILDAVDLALKNTSYEIVLRELSEVNTKRAKYGRSLVTVRQ